MSKTIHFSILILMLIVFLLLGFYSTYKEYTHYQFNINNTKANILKSEKDKLNIEVNAIISLINYHHNVRVKKIEEAIKQEVLVGHKIMESIYNQYYKTKTKKEILELFRLTLKDIRFFGGFGYYFIDDISDGNIILNPIEGFEGTSFSSFIDKNGVNIFEKFKDTINNEKEEGFVNWSFYRPDNNEIESDKKGFIKLFKPYNIIIGTADYSERYEEVLKDDLINEFIKNIEYGQNNQLFILSSKGEIILSQKQPEYNGKNYKSISDKNIKIFITKLIHLNKEMDNDYLTYFISINDKKVNRLAYIKRFKKWNWIVGSAVDIDYIDKLATTKNEFFKEHIKRDILYILVIFFSLYVLVYIYMRLFSKRIAKSFNIFTKFFNNIEKPGSSIDNNDFLFQEFYELSLGANLMVRKIKQKQEEIENKNKQLLLKYQELKDTQKKLIKSEKSVLLSSTIASISHELNTPIGIAYTAITHINDELNFLKEKYNKEELSEKEFYEFIKTSDHLNISIITNLEKINELIKSFKMISRSDSLDLTQEFNLKNYIDNAILTLSSILKQKNITIQLDIDDNLYIKSRKISFYHILSNLITNSLTHAFDNTKEGKVTISAYKKENTLFLRYKDDGCGIDENIKDNMFKTFFTTKKSNSGLGLNIVHTIVTDELNGNINVVTKNKGLEFKFIIPLEFI